MGANVWDVWRSWGKPQWHEPDPSAGSCGEAAGGAFGWLIFARIRGRCDHVSHVASPAVRPTLRIALVLK